MAIGDELVPQEDVAEQPVGDNSSPSTTKELTEGDQKSYLAKIKRKNKNYLIKLSDSELRR